MSIRTVNVCAGGASKGEKMGDPGQPKEQGEKIGIASIGMLVGPLLVAMGGLALTGTIGRVQRDYPKGLSIAIGLVVLSGVIWVAASIFFTLKQGEKRRKGDYALRLTSLVFAGVGFVLAMYLAVETANNEPRPEISPTLAKTGDELTVNVTVPNLSSKRRLAFQVDLVEQSSIVETIYQAYVGPDGDGNVDQTVTVPLPERNDYREVGVTAYTGDTKPACEGPMPDPGSEAGAACVVLTLP